jgi:acyl-CoA thioester hydrolase
MPEPFRTTRRVEFRDTDAAGIMHFSAFFGYMEEAEHELLRSLGLSVIQPDGEGTLSWPRVSAECNFERPLKFEEEFRVEVRLARLGTKSVTYGFRFTRGGAGIAAGFITAVCCRISSDGPPVAIAIPPWIHDRLRPLVEPSGPSPSA